MRDTTPKRSRRKGSCGASSREAVENSTAHCFLETEPSQSKRAERKAETATGGERWTKRGTRTRAALFPRGISRTAERISVTTFASAASKVTRPFGKDVLVGMPKASETRERKRARSAGELLQNWVCVGARWPSPIT